MSLSGKLRALLDTTYLLPVVDVEIDIPDDMIDKLLSGDFEYVINEIMLFELYGKARREFRHEKVFFLHKKNFRIHFGYLAQST